MRPCLTQHNAADLRLNKAVGFGDMLLRVDTSCIHSADFPNVVFGERCASVALTARSLSALFTIFRVIGMCAPVEVAGRIIKSVIVFMAHLCVLKRRLAVEGERDHSVNVCVFALPVRIESNARIAHASIFTLGLSGPQEFGFVF